MNRTYDVAVIGGGMIGLSTAYSLIKRGKKVILIEKKDIGSGASSACDDMILLQSKKPGISLEMAMESLEIYKGLSKELNWDIEFESHGGMILIETEEELATMEEFVNKQKSYGLEVDIIEKKDVLRKQPNVHKNILASTYSKNDSQVNPLQVMSGFLSKGCSLGLEVRKKTVIKSITPRKDYWKIELDDGSWIETENVVNAAGAWAPEIGEMIGVDIPITPRKGQIAVTEQIPAIGETNAWTAEYIVSKLDPTKLRPKEEIFKELGIGFSFSRSATGNYLIGSTRENSGYDTSTNFEAIQIIIQQATRLFPIMQDVHIIRTFAGLRPVTPDGKAIIGEVEKHKGFFIAAGHEGDGIALAPITGKLVADLIEHKSTNYNMAELNIARFSK